jgi:hypothetical protein
MIVSLSQQPAGTLSRRRCHLRGPVLICALAALLAVLGQNLPAATAASAQTAGETTYLNTSPGVEYVGSTVCAGCHADIFNDYVKTDMGRSMSLASDPEQLARVARTVTLHDEKLNRYFQVLRQGSTLYQSEYELTPDGSEVFRNTQEIAYGMGSGANGISYIVRRGNYLFEAPLSYYSKSRSWELSPGYEFGDYGFGRAIPAMCVACHSGRAQPVGGRDGLYRDPPFKELAIGCENCHGPGELHVEERAKGVPVPGNVDPAIVNPAKLPGWLADNICMNCHQGGDSKVLQPGKTLFDFRPGTPLEDTLAIFAVPPQRGAPPSDPLLQHYWSMILSRCYRSSAGRMGCITCHDPHRQPTSTAASYYRARCLTCHTEANCRVPLKARMAKSPADDCAGCHMPKQSLVRISHSALTDHRIIARAGNPYPEAAFHDTAPDLPDLVHLNAIPSAKDAVAPLTLFQAYGSLMDSHPEYRARYLAVLGQLAPTQPEHPLVLSGLAWKSLRDGTTEGQTTAIAYLTKAIEHGSVAAADFETLVDLLSRAGRTSEALALAQQGIDSNPYDQRLYKSLALLNITARHYSDALAAMEKELELFPEDDFMRGLVKKAQAAPAAP